MGAAVLVLKVIADPQTLEKIAIREALALSDDLYQRHVHVASDCKVAVEDLKKENSSVYGAIIHEIIKRSTNFTSCSFVHEHRNFNFEAHNLAKLACNLQSGRHLWLVNPYDQRIVPMNITDNQ